VHGARPANNEKTVIALLNDLNSLFAALEDGGLGVCRSRDLGCEELGLDKRILAEDWRERGRLARTMLECSRERNGSRCIIPLASSTTSLVLTLIACGCVCVARTGELCSRRCVHE
jgi:hypothetical protein